MIQAILSALACGNSGCPCASALSRGKGKTHCPVRSDTDPSLDVQEGDDGTPLLYCHSCKGNEAEIQALRDRGLWQAKPTMRVINGGATSAMKAVDMYEYTDRNSKAVMRAIRYEPKDFRQCRPDGKGGWIWNLEGVKLVLYHLPKVIAAVERGDTLFVVEGERDVETIEGLGLAATCNPMGAGKWRDEFSLILINADVVVIADDDEPGRKHARQVLESLALVARSLKLVELPQHDATDYVSAGGDKDKLLALVQRTPQWAEDVRQILTGRDLVALYRDVMAKRMTGDTDYLEIATGLTELDKYAQYQPGDLWLVVAATGVGKSAMLSSMQGSLDDRSIPSLFVSLEMSWLVIVERMLAGGLTLEQIEKRVGLLVDEASLTTERLEVIAKVAKLRGVRVLFVDYAQRLAGDKKDSEYERVSAISNDLARIARETRLCIVAAAQVSRQGASRDGNPPQLSEIRASGHLEQDAAVVLALGRKPGESMTWISIQKNRHGQVKKISILFDAARGKFDVEKVSGPAPQKSEGPDDDIIPF